jgi:signal transduction histidine kinase
MTVNLVSSDPELYAQLRHILDDMPELSRSLALVWNASGEKAAVADLHIWDFQPNLSLPKPVGGPSLRHLFLVDRKDLNVFQERTAFAAGNVLLKPAGRATLSAFLTQALTSAVARRLHEDRDEMLQCLIQTNLRLQEYDQDRATFLARSVHDFRAPLTALSGYCGLFLSGHLGSLNETQREILGRMQHSANRLSRMAGAMFELSVGRHVKRRPQLRPGDIYECVEQALHEIAPFAREKSLAITVDLTPPDGCLCFEVGQIEQVLINIFDNACKFTPKGGSIEVRGYPYFWERRRVHTPLPAGFDRRGRNNAKPNSYRIDITDAGLPIPNELLVSIFEEYTSYGGGRDRSGGGIGLAICRMIVSQHEGRIWAENIDSGPLFAFVLPLGRSEELPREDATQLPRNTSKNRTRPIRIESSHASK